MIDLVNVKKRFGAVEAVQGVTLHAAPGEILGLLGPNGAGKTTTIRMVTGYLPPTSGSVTVAGYDSVRDSLKLRSQIGYMPESAALHPEMRVVDHLDFCGRIHLMDRRRRRVGLDRVIERCWLQEVRRRRVGQLSKGYRQRVSLACALIHDPPALVLDEPTSGLDPTQIIETRKLVRELSSDRTMILCSHILPEVERTCDRVVLLARGRVRAEGSIPELTGASAGTSVILDLGRGGFSGPATEQWLRDQPEVLSARSIGESDQFLVELASRGGVEARASISRRIIEAGFDLREFRSERPSLEGLFLRALDDGADKEPDS